jgi:ring-1,2-phenylacetyl-CoA epoxidase subunit PaaC
MAFDNAYEAIVEDNDSRWAFGTGFSDPLSGVDVTIPSDVDRHDLALYCLMLGDDALVMSHRLQEWCTNLPELEEEVAVANIGLDLLGQARLLLSRAGAVDGGPESPLRHEDRYAFFRDEQGFRNVRLVEIERGDFGELIARLVVFATWRLALLTRLVGSSDPVLSAVAAKGVKELAYHRDYAARWAIRLGDGTPYSNERVQAGFDTVWPLVGELFQAHDVERRLALAGAGVDPSVLREEFDSVLTQVFTAATLRRPVVAPPSRLDGHTGRHGVHTEALGPLLAELQSVARAHPEATW